MKCEKLLWTLICSIPENSNRTWNRRASGKTIKMRQSTLLPRHSGLRVAGSGGVQYFRPARIRHRGASLQHLIVQKRSVHTTHCATTTNWLVPLFRYQELTVDLKYYTAVPTIDFNNSRPSMFSILNVDKEY